MAKYYELNVTMSAEHYQLLKMLSEKMGYSNKGQTIQSGLILLKGILQAQDNGLVIGTFNLKTSTFVEWLFPKAKVLQKEDLLAGKVITCEKCGKDFTLKEGDKVREGPGHEGMTFADCPHCSWSNSF